MGLIEESVGEESWANRHVTERDKFWSKGLVNHADRVVNNQHKPLLLVLTGNVSRENYKKVGTELEKELFEKGVQVYRYGFQFLRMADTDAVSIAELRQDMFRQLLDIGYAFMDAGMVFITAIRGLTSLELKQLKTISQPFDVVIIDLESPSAIADLYWDEHSQSMVIQTILDKISPS